MRRSSDDRRFTVAISRAQYDQVVKAAALNYRSVNSQVRMWIDEGLRRAAADAANQAANEVATVTVPTEAES